MIKSHGGADVVAFANAVKIAEVEIAQDIPKKISERVQQVLAERKH